MKTIHKLDSIFAPLDNSLGIVLIISGIAASFHTLSALFLSVVGIFLTFTKSFSIIYFEKKIIKSGILLFGIIPYAKVIDIQDSMKLKLIKKHSGFRMYSRSNRQLDVHSSDFRIILLNSKNNKLVELTKNATQEAAQKEIFNLKTKLNLQICT